MVEMRPERAFSWSKRDQSRPLTTWKVGLTRRSVAEQWVCFTGDTASWRGHGRLERADEVVLVANEVVDVVSLRAGAPTSAVGELGGVRAEADDDGLDPGNIARGAGGSNTAQACTGGASRGTRGYRRGTGRHRYQGDRSIDSKGAGPGSGSNRRKREMWISGSGHRRGHDGSP